ncbi:MAG: zinc ribbon domain-containing protein [Prevotella sp.]|jgi:hypothetical protein|nr:zinc ribbon domain-containing protein [Prevotella sp.]
MKASQIYSGTIGFCWLKLALGIVDVLIGAVLFAVVMGIAALTASGEVGAVLFFVWMGVWGFVHWMIQHYIGYLLKAGHVAAIAQTFKDGAIPSNPVAFGKDRVKERFLTANVYFVIDRLVAGAVKQLQRLLGKALGLFGNVPGGDTIKKVGDLFINISLGYIDECCLGYTFYHTEQNVYKSAADGVVVYAQNWKPLLKDAAKTTFVVLLTIVAVTLLSFVLIGGLFRLMEWNMLVAVILSLLVSFSVRYAFVDSWILVKMMSSYFNAASTTVITFDLYAKLRNLSSKFGELLKKAGNDQPPAPAQSAPSAFCPHCGSPIAAGKSFCGNCGGRAITN